MPEIDAKPRTLAEFLYGDRQPTVFTSERLEATDAKFQAQALGCPVCESQPQLTHGVQFLDLKPRGNVAVYAVGMQCNQEGHHIATSGASHAEALQAWNSLPRAQASAS